MMAAQGAVAKMELKKIVNAMSVINVDLGGYVFMAKGIFGIGASGLIDLLRQNEDNFNAALEDYGNRNANAAIWIIKTYLQPYLDLGASIKVRERDPEAKRRALPIPFKVCSSITNHFLSFFLSSYRFSPMVCPLIPKITSEIKSIEKPSCTAKSTSSLPKTLKSQKQKHSLS